MRTLARSLLLVFLIGTPLGLGACNEREVASRLDYARSTEMLVALNRAGIAAEMSKESSGTQTTFSITVDDSQFNQALEIIHEYGLSKTVAESSPGVGGSFGGETFLPPSRELTLLEYDNRLSLQLERLLRGYEGVVDVRAVVRGALAEANSRVTILIRYASSSGKSPLTEEQVRQLVSGIVPTAKPDGVMTVMERVNFQISGNSTTTREAGGRETGDAPVMERLSPLGFRVLSVERTRAQQQLAGVVVIVAVSALVIGIYAGWSMSARNFRRRLAKRTTESPSDNFFGEAASAERVDGTGEAKVVSTAAGRTSEI